MAENILKRLVNNSKAAIGDGTYEISASRKGSDRDLLHSIRTGPHATIIAEIKFSSPSLGRIRTASDPGVIARRMVAGGARALSVLTQPHLFGGSPEYLLRVRDAVDVPLLMKDIIIDGVQIEAAGRIGADYVLLIQSLWDAGHLEDIDGMISHAHDRGLKVLLEVHTRQELEKASGTAADLIGVNNRNLDTMEIDLGTTGKVLSGFDDRTVPVLSESGIRTPEDVRYLKGCGADAFLVGSSIMGSGDVEGHVRGLVNSY